jgi:ParB family chromosome partitioning protein
MPPRRSALGRGLDALIPEEPVPLPSAAPVRESESGLGAARELPVDVIRPNPDQPRRVFAEAELERLAASIVRHGVLQPIVVREREGGGYELVVGERRWRASKLAGRTTVPAVIQDVSAPALLEVALVENVQRRDLNPIELAQAFRGLAERGHTQEEIGERVGLDRSTVANHLRLLELPRELQADVEEGTLSGGHAKALLSVTSPEQRRHLRDRIAGEGLSVRAAEELARRMGGGRRRRPSPRESVDPNLEQLLGRLRDRLQTRVRISGSPRRGKLEVEFYGPEELNRITSTILDGR